MNKYELCVVVSAKIEDEERAAVVDRCKALIERFGGTITNVDDWGKRRLAYEIQKMKEGFYYFIQFDAEATVPIEIENRVRIMDNVIRYLVVRADEAVIAAKAKADAEAAAAAEAKEEPEAADVEAEA